MIQTNIGSPLNKTAIQRRRRVSIYFTLLLLLLASMSSGNSAPQPPGKNSEGQTGTFERLIVATGNVTMDLDLNRLNGNASATKESKVDTFRFTVSSNSFFTIRLFNEVLRGPEAGSMGLIWESSAVLPEPLRASSNQLVIAKTRAGERFDLLVRDGKTGFVFFNIEGDLYDYDPATHLLSINGGRLLISVELANKLGRAADAGLIVGEITIATNMYPIETTTFVNGAAKSSTLPPRRGRSPNAPGGSVPGPDIVVGDMFDLAQFGSSGNQVGLGMGTTSCNNGDQPIHFYQLPNPDHSIISQNLYRMSGGATNTERLEQIGQSWVKHTFGADQSDDCSFGCIPYPNQLALGVGCSDAYLASQNASQTNHVGALGSRAWVNPFTGAFPVSPRPDDHTGHNHTGTSHRILVNTSDLDTTMNPGATYYAEVQYDSPHEYAWCQSHAGQCNMYNNASYTRYNVSGTTSFDFSPVGGASIMTPATAVWPGATTVRIEPEPGIDGRAFVVYKVTNPSPDVWHYEYAIHNQNLDRSIQSFSVPLGAGITLSNLGFHAPPNHPGYPNDGTAGNAGFSNAAWTSDQTADTLTWSSETFAQNQNANAIRFGTLYNFRFDSNRSPQATDATIGFFKTGKPITVPIQGPAPDLGLPTPTPTPAAQALNLSTRMRVQTGGSVGIAGLIVTGSSPKHLLIRAIGPSLTGSGVPDVLADPMLELHGPGPIVTITNNNWRDTQEAEIQATGIAPSNDLESAIVADFDPGAYTAIVSGNGNTVGVGLIEVYDLTGAVPAKLANISTRAFVDRDDNIVIAGFILANNPGLDRVIVRGIGPSLTAMGIAGALANPTLELRDGNGASLASNNNWLDDPAQAAEIAEAGLAPTEDLESAIAATLPPGLYTALLSGLNSSTGIGLVEVYDRGVQ
jgi:hypothetical protein